MRKTTFLIAILAMILTFAGGAMADEPAASKGKTESKDKGGDKGGDKGKDESKAGKTESKAPDKDPDPDYKSDPIVGDHTKGG